MHPSPEISFRASIIVPIGKRGNGTEYRPSGYSILFLDVLNISFRFILLESTVRNPFYDLQVS